MHYEKLLEVFYLEKIRFKKIIFKLDMLCAAPLYSLYYENNLYDIFCLSNFSNCVK